MLDRDRLDRLLDLQRPSYALLRLIDAKVQSGTLPLDSLHGALDASAAAAEWLTRHASSLPPDVRPPEGALSEFAHLFSSYLVTSFEIRSRKKVRAACGCELCAYFVDVPSLKARDRMPALMAFTCHAPPFPTVHNASSPIGSTAAASPYGPSRRKRTLSRIQRHKCATIRARREVPLAPGAAAQF